MIEVHARPFSPRLADGTRLFMKVSESDAQKVMRGSRDYMGQITDLTSGKHYDVWGADCGLPTCICDALATEIKERTEEI